MTIHIDLVIELTVSPIQVVSSAINILIAALTAVTPFPPALC